MPEPPESFVRIRRDEAAAFCCARCRRDKISENAYEWLTPEGLKTICNGCHGELLAKDGASR